MKKMLFSNIIKPCRASILSTEIAYYQASRSCFFVIEVGRLQEMIDMVFCGDEQAVKILHGVYSGSGLNYLHDDSKNSKFYKLQNVLHKRVSECIKKYFAGKFDNMHRLFLYHFEPKCIKNFGYTVHDALTLILYNSPFVSVEFMESIDCRHSVVRLKDHRSIFHKFFRKCDKQYVFRLDSVRAVRGTMGCMYIEFDKWMLEVGPRDGVVMNRL